MSITEKREAVYQQFVKQYIDHFNIEIGRIPADICIAKALYLFTFSDFYGKITFVGDTGDVTKIDKARNNFTHLIKKYFPAKFQSLADEIYEIYRCGVMHTIFPKNSGLVFFVGNDELVVESEVGLPSQRYKIKSLNLWKYEQILSGFINDYSTNIVNGVLDKQVIHIYQLIKDDIFGDKTASEKY